MGSTWALPSLQPGCRTTALVALAVASPAVLVIFHERAERRRLEQMVVKYRDSAERQTKLRDEERRGRTRAEQRLRKVGQAAPVLSNGSHEHADALETEKAALDAGDSQGFVFHPIGTFASCYRSRCGTPRQSGLVESLSVLHCSRDLNPAAALEGFGSYSHCWVLYVFHENTNLQREGVTVARRQQRGAQQQKGRVPLWQGLCMKVAPPRCTNLRVGVLSCRTPHRPNPIGLSLARIVKVDMKAGEVILAGLDVVDGTPCLDLKPYLPSYESIPTARVPSWVQTSYEEPLMRVDWSPDAAIEFDRLLKPDASKQPVVRSRPFDSVDDLCRALEGTLALDIRSPVQRTRHPNPGATSDQEASTPFFVGDLWFHELHVTYALLPTLPSESRVAGASVRVRIERVEQRQVGSNVCIGKDEYDEAGLSSVEVDHAECIVDAGAP